MVATVLIVASALILLVYWFRYSCLLLLRNSTAAMPKVAVADLRFSVEQIRPQVFTAMDLDPLQRLLDSDYRLLVYLRNHAGLGLDSMEDRLLVLDYRIMKFWYRLTRVFQPQVARRALAEMSDVLLIFVRRIASEPELA